jgi:hypothetical protein
MFVDVCFPKNNELLFANIAEKLGINGLLFIYSDKRSITNMKQKNNLKFGGFYGFLEKKSDFFEQINVEGKMVLIFKTDTISSPTQVHIKELGALSIPLIIPLVWPIRQRLPLVLELCYKHGIKIAPSCCATFPYGLRPSYETASMFKMLGAKETQSKEGMSCLYDYLSNE